MEGQPLVQLPGSSQPTVKPQAQAPTPMKRRNPLSTTAAATAAAMWQQQPLPAMAGCQAVTSLGPVLRLLLQPSAAAGLGLQTSSRPLLAGGVGTAAAVWGVA